MESRPLAAEGGPALKVARRRTPVSGSSLVVLLVDYFRLASAAVSAAVFRPRWRLKP